MTEQEWLVSKDPSLMLRFLIGRNYIYTASRPAVPSNRKLRLFACACCRQIWPLLTDRRSRAAVEAAERHADGLIGGDELAAARGAAWDAASDAARDAASAAAWSAAWSAVGAAVGAAARDAASAAASAAARARQADLLRDIVGNPFWPVTFAITQPDRYVCAGCGAPRYVAPRESGFSGCECGVWHWRQTDERDEWLTPDVLAVAALAYGERLPDGTLDSARLAVLSDALEEAGCVGDEPCKKCHGSGTYTVQVTNAGLSAANGYGAATTYSEWRGCRGCGGDHDRKGSGKVAAPHPLLAHLRSPGVHVRGCWALDLIRGAS